MPPLQDPNDKKQLAELQTENKSLKAQLEQLKSLKAQLESENAVLKAQLEKAEARIYGLLKAQDKDGRLTKRVTPYLPPGTSPN